MRGFLVFVAMVVFAGGAGAETGLQLAVPGARVPDDPHVSGLRLSILHGRNQIMRGVDFGLLSLSETANLSGFQAVAGVGKVTGSMNGLASSLMNIHTGTDTGVNAAFINRVNTVESGANVGFVNVADGYTMVDLGGLNVSDRSSVQLGFLNVTKTIRGVQLGFLNIAENGFLPVFPFFNFPKNR